MTMNGNKHKGFDEKLMLRRNCKRNITVLLSNTQIICPEKCLAKNLIWLVDCGFHHPQTLCECLWVVTTTFIITFFM